MNLIEYSPHSFQYLKVEVITPLHIGSGRQLVQGHDFVPMGEKGRTLLVPDLQAFAEEMVAQPAQWQAWQQDSLAQQQPEENFLSRYFARHPKPHSLALRSLPLGKDMKKAPLTFKECIQLPEGRAYLPGSSLKGALRTVWLTDLFLGWKKGGVPPLKRSFNSGAVVLKDQPYLERAGMGFEKMDQNPMRMVRVGDGIFPLRATECAEVKVYNLCGSEHDEKWTHSGGRHFSLNHAVEVVKPGTVTAIRVDWGGMIPALAGAVVKTNSRRDHKNVTVPSGERQLRRITPPPSPIAWNEMAKIIRLHHFELIEAELDFWRDFEGVKGAPEGIWEAWDVLWNLLDGFEQGELLLQLGAGSGWKGMTGDWQEDLLNDDEWNALRQKMTKGRSKSNPDLLFPKTRRLVHGQPMGWVKLTPITEDAYYGILAQHGA